MLAPISSLAFGWVGTLSSLGCGVLCLAAFVWCMTRGGKERIRAAFYERLGAILCRHLAKHTELPEEELHTRVMTMLATRTADRSLNGLESLQMQLQYAGQGSYTLRLILLSGNSKTTLETDNINWTDLPAEIRDRELEDPQDVQTFDLAK